MRKEVPVSIWTGIMIAVAIISLGVILYQKTNFFPTIAKWLEWFYNGLKDFNWRN